MLLDDPIYSDVGRPATLSYAGRTVDLATLRETVSVYQKLGPESRATATIRIVGGPILTAGQIKRLLNRPSDWPLVTRSLAGLADAYQF
jgi:hypothetical protein